MNHCIGTLHANVPRNGDNSALHHILNITKSSKSRDIASAITRQLDPNKMPQHFVLATKHNMIISPLMANVSKVTLARIEQGYKLPNKEYGDMIL